MKNLTTELDKISRLHTTGSPDRGLKILLSDGPLSKKEIDNQSREAGIKNITLRRAKSILEIETIHEGYGKGSVWKWCLPSSKVLKCIKGAHTNNVSTIEENEHLLSD